MDMTVDKPKQDSYWRDLLSSIPKTIKDVVSRLVGFFELTEVEKKESRHPFGQPRT
jgi:hypothetical protein